MAECLHGCKDDDRSARSPDPSLQHHRNRKRQLALQEPRRRSHNNPRSRRLRNPDQLRRRERYRPDSSNKRVKIGRRSGVKFASRLTLIATIVGIMTLMITASGVFGEMQSALNAIWKAEPTGLTTLSRLIRARAASLGLVTVLGFLL